MSSVALAIEKLTPSGNNTMLLVPHKIMKQRHIATVSRIYIDSSFISGEISSNFALFFLKSASAFHPHTNLIGLDFSLLYVR